MGRIKKAAGPKHEATVSPAISQFVAIGVDIHVSVLPAHLRSFPQGWPFPRGDLYHWIPLLNRFDSILESFNIEYGLYKAPQTRPFERRLLLAETECGPADSRLRSPESLDVRGYGPDGDRELVKSILKHSQMLLENCGNRSLYNSSDRLGDLLNTTDLSLLSATLEICVRLAQRYYTSRQRVSSASQHLNHALLASHYNIDLEKVQKLANPFTRPTPSPIAAPTSSLNTPNGKERGSSFSHRKPSLIDANDLLRVVQGPSSGSIDSEASSTTAEDSSWAKLASVHFTFHQSTSVVDGEKPPTTPTPARRTSALSRPSQLSNSDGSAEPLGNSGSHKSEETKSSGMRHIEISPAQMSSTSVEDILRDHLNDVPKDSAYEFLARIRTASAMLGSGSERQQAVGIRLLAITNLAYIYPETIFQHRILQPDLEEPRPLQLVHQLTSLLNPPGNGSFDIEPKLQTIALGTLEAFSKHKSKEPDVCAALSINVNHGVIFYVLRKAIAELATADSDAPGTDIEERRDAIFSLVEDLPRPSTNRVGETLVAAGLLEILIEALALRTKAAERTFPKILSILHKVIFNPREGLQTFANAKGLDHISDLIAYEVQSSLESAQKGEGLSQRYRNKITDYQIPFYQRETLTKLFRNISSMMQNSSGNFDRLLRNFIDSPPLLGGLRTTILNAGVFGAAIWSGAVNIMSSFIHNEPTSYAVISEAGLSRGLLEAISGKPAILVDGKDELSGSHNIVNDSGNSGSANGSANVPASSVSTSQHDAFMSELAKRKELDHDPSHDTAQGILPHVEAILAIPQAFGAICLNHSGMELFLASAALDKFFKVFESIEHVKALNNSTVDYDTPRILGNAFDELVRHHPNLRAPVLASVMTMIDRITRACEYRGAHGCGAKLWMTEENDQAVSAMEEASNRQGDDLVMDEAVQHTGITSGSSTRCATDDDKEENNICIIIEIAMRFLSGLFENSTFCSNFVEYQGAEKVLNLATLPCLPYDYNNQTASQEVAKVIHMMAEQKPHFVLPDLVRRAVEAVDSLAPVYQHDGPDGFFQIFTEPSQQQIRSSTTSGIDIAVSLVNVHTLCNILYEVFSTPIMHQSRMTPTPFTQVNLADVYQGLIQNLGLLHRVCVWEEILLQKRLPDSWKEATRIKGYGMGSEEADEIFGFINNEDDTVQVPSPGLDNFTNGTNDGSSSLPAPQPSRTNSISKDEGTAQFKNARTLRYLLSQIPSCIVPFFQGLGKALANKRRPDTYLRQNAHLVAEAMSSAMLGQLSFEAPRKSASAKDRYAYWIVILTSISQLIIEGSMERSHVQVLTLVLQAFKNDGGLDAISEIIKLFYEEVKSYTDNSSGADNAIDKAARLTSAYGGIKIILNFYTQITTSKAITESSQSQALTTTDRDLGHAFYFSAPQLLVELRLAILPNVRLLWGYDFVNKASTSIVKCLIEILTTILEGTEEEGAFKRTSKVQPRRKHTQKTYSITQEKLQFLTNQGFDKERASEALYRCMNVQSTALEYCQHTWIRPLSLPIPAYDREKPRQSVNPMPQRSASGPVSEVAPASQTATQPGQPDAADRDTTDAADGLFLLARGGYDATANDNAMLGVEEADAGSRQGDPMPPPPPAPAAPEDQESVADGMQMSIENLLGLAPEMVAQTQQTLESHLSPDQARSTGPSPPGSVSGSFINGFDTPTEPTKGNPQVTSDDLDDERAELRGNLVERVLDVLNVHEDVTFELAALITAAVVDEEENVDSQFDIGETLVQALISFSPAMGNEDIRDSGKKIAANAHLLGIVLQEEKFFFATLMSLQENMDNLISFVRILPDQTPDQSSPWISPVLLVIERILGEDVQPVSVDWEPPPPDQPAKADIESAISMDPPVLSSEIKMQLFDALLEVMPRIGKDESLVLSVVRTLVPLSRSREIADKLGDKRNIQRLFLMVKQLSGMTNEMLPGTFMILLRHIVEDDEMVRQIMKSEIVNNFEMRSGRHTDVMGYLRQMNHLVLRSPKIFIEVTNNMCEVAKYDPQQRYPILSLKPEPKDDKPAEGPSTTAATAEPVTAENKETGTNQEMKAPAAGEQKGKTTESKAPVVERPSGVIHYLLTELLAYKDVDDKEPIPAIKSSESQDAIVPTIDNVDTDHGSSSAAIPGSADVTDKTSETKKLEKLEFKFQQHPIHIYRCFILQCLTELLQSYNQVKIEFVNFSRKADPKAMTPSKPRSGVLNYLLNDVISVGTLNHEDSIAFRKRNNTSNWAISAIVSLCLRTNEAGYEKKPGSIDEDDQPDLLFVRKFVLEHALKAYKDASTSDEHPDTKYARLLDIADLFQRLLMGRLVAPGGPSNQSTELGVQHSIAKLMYEKNFIAALTGSIADIDLNFPGSKRAVKYILRPLKQLTTTAIKLSQESDISTTLGNTDDDEISTATSVSDIADEREETPDLFRNSTLDMFEPNRNEESQTESSGDEDDDEMYDDEEDEGEPMDFENEMERDPDEVVSDEEEEAGEMGHMEGLHGDAGMDVEVVIDGEDEDEEDDDEEDDDDEDLDDSEDDMDDDGDIEVIDEITGDAENASLDEDEDVDWEDEIDGGENVEPDEPYNVDHEDAEGVETAVRDIIEEFGGGTPARGSGIFPPRGADLHTLEGGLTQLEGVDDGPSDLQMDVDSERYMDDVVRREEDEDEEDDDGEERDADEEDEEDMYNPELNEDERIIPDAPWGFDPDEDPFLNDVLHHHHHHHHHHHRHIPRRFQDSWSAWPGGPSGLRTAVPLYRSHRPVGGLNPPFPPDDTGANPLLRRNDRNSGNLSRVNRSTPSDAAAGLSDYWVHGMEMGVTTPRMMTDSPVSFVNSIIAAIGNGSTTIPTLAGNAPIHIQFGGPPGTGRAGMASSSRDLPRELQSLLGTRHHHREPARPNRDDHPQPAVVLPQPTYRRWQEESRLLYSTSATDKAIRVLNSILRLLIPPAIEKKRLELEMTKRLREQQEKAREEALQAKQKAEKEEQARKEIEEREAMERAAQEAQQAAAAAAEADGDTEAESDGQAATRAAEGAADGPMEGIEDTQSEAINTVGGNAASTEIPVAGESEQSQPTERIMTRLGDREIDITGLGIDLAYLDALPEDIRQEVLMSQIAIQRSQAAEAGQPPTEISGEFLEALPPEIREELLQQEAADRRRRERQETQRQAATAGGEGPRAEDMDPASFLASLEPTLRQHVLMEQDEDMLAHLPAEIAAEARALGGEQGMHRFAGIPGRGSRGLARQMLDGAQRAIRHPHSPAKKPPRKQVVQMLDKAGVATLLRLMFIPQQGSGRELFNAVLRNVSENRQNRAEVVSLLLSILQDGSIDVNAVERSFNHLSLRAKQPKDQRTPQPLKRTLTGSALTGSNSVEATPLTVIQQCLSTLVALTQANPHIPSFFLTEHDLSSGAKNKLNRKGKGKETRAQKYPLNALLGLLDRKLIMESSGCLEQLASLLQRVTHPLNILLRKEQEEIEKKPASDAPEVSSTSPTNVLTTTSTGEQVVQDAPPSTEAPTDSPMTGVQSTNNADPAEESQSAEGAPVPASEPRPDATAQTEEQEQAETDKQDKKIRALAPPVIPEENLRLIVGIIAARECSKRTFQQTVATISNLKAIPGAQQIFGKGLIEQAQDLAQSILSDLDELLPQIQQAESGTDIQGLALTKFATASSDQSKLLRVLTALDYLFGPKADEKKSATEKNHNTQVFKEDDLLTSLYENSTFGPLWEKLSECLSAIRQGGGGMLNIASILQPLIEALMVVCKNTTLKDSPLVKAQKEFSITSPAPESRMESLFFKFTEEHRKILNELVRHSPKLMMGTFSLLVKNPKVLEFDNKRSYFTKRLHSRGTETRHSQPPLQLSVRRDQVFLDSFKFLSFKSGDEIKYGKLSIRFHGEEGVDAGGVTREWFQVLSRQMFNPDYALFIPVASDRTTFHPNKLSKVNEEHLMFFKFIGRIIGKALYEGRALDCHFSRAVYKRILGKTVSIKDMETLDLDYYKSLLWMLENDITEIITETFSVETDDFGVTETVDLIENGRNVPVTEENKQEYVQLVVEYRLTGSVQTQLAKFLEGFHDIVSPELISIFNEQELELLISGLPDIDVDDWKNHTEYHNYRAASPQIQWFWRAVRSFDKEERAKLLQFVTGTSKVPLNGFGQLEGMNGFSKFNIHRDYGNKERLPSSHTCFNQLDLPEYDSYEALRSHVYTAMTAGSEYFGFA